MGTVSQIRPGAAVVFDARIAAAACQAQLSRISLVAGLAIVGITTAEGRAEVTADGLAALVGYSRPSMLKALRTIEDRELGRRARTEVGHVLPVFTWAVDRLPSLLRKPEPAEPVESTSRELWQEVFSTMYRERFSRDTEAGRLSAVVPNQWPKDPGWERLTDWSARRARELGLDPRRVVELACEHFFALPDKLDPNLRAQRYPLGFLPPVLDDVDRALVARLTAPMKRAARERAAVVLKEIPANEDARSRVVPSLSEIEEMIAAASGRRGE